MAYIARRGARKSGLRPDMSFLRDLRGSAQPVDAETVMAIIDVVKAHWDALRVHRAAIVMSLITTHPR